MNAIGKSSARLFATGAAPLVTPVTKAERRQIEDALARRGLSLRKIDPKLTRAQREALSRERQIRFAARRATP